MSYLAIALRMWSRYISVVIVMVGCSFQFVGGVCLSGGTVHSIRHGVDIVKHKFAIF